MITNLQLKKIDELINRHYQRHSERINFHAQDNNYTLEYFINFYFSKLLNEIQQLLDLDNQSFQQLKQVKKFHTKVILKLQKVVLQLANKAMDARLYPPTKTDDPKPNF